MFRKKVFQLQSIAILVGLLLMGVKFFAWWVTNSNAILTDALESIINIVAGFTGLYSLWLAAKPRDRNHPYGHGKIEFVSAGFEGGLILLAGVIIMVKAVYNLIYPQEIQQLDLGILLVGISGLINFGLGWMLRHYGKVHHTLILRAAGAHLQSDAYSSAGLLIGLGLVYWLGFTWMDNATAMIFGLIIIFTGFKLLRTSLAGIMDEADYQLITEAVSVLDQQRPDDWIDVHNFRAIKYGATLHFDCHLTLPWFFEVRRAHEEVERLEQLMDQHFLVPVELFIHVDPCEPPQTCRVCQKKDCSVRQAPAEKRISWTLENIMKNQRHEQI